MGPPTLVDGDIACLRWGRHVFLPQLGRRLSSTETSSPIAPAAGPIVGLQWGRRLSSTETLIRFIPFPPVSRCFNGAADSRRRRLAESRGAVLTMAKASMGPPTLVDGDA